MRARNVIGKTIDLDRVRKDVGNRQLSGVHLSGSGDQKLAVIELVVRPRTNGYVYAVNLLMDGDRVTGMKRVKFASECGGWRGKEIELKRFPIHFHEVESGCEWFVEEYSVRK